MTKQKQTRQYPVYERDSDLLDDLLESVLARRGIGNTSIGVVSGGRTFVIYREDIDKMGLNEFDSMCKELKATAAGLRYGYFTREGPRKEEYIITLSRGRR